ncbi:hypothetical protein GCM10009096_19100 [Parasphingorhabdus litoris]|uniref:Uncharacterized protein n=1 Tax=Parasphingorhabdus litoris TaxID=394733 RepID=A0ABN1AII8_9SPHN
MTAKDAKAVIANQSEIRQPSVVTLNHRSQVFIIGEYNDSKTFSFARHKINPRALVT